MLYTASRTLGRYADEWRLGIGGDLHGHGRAHGKNERSRSAYRGLEVLGGGSILGGLILGAMAVCIIDRHFMKGAGFALAGAILTFFGFMHGHQIGIAHDPTVAFSYLIVAVIFAGCAKLVVVDRSKETIASGPALPQLANSVARESLRPQPDDRRFTIQPVRLGVPQRASRDVRQLRHRGRDDRSST